MSVTRKTVAENYKVGFRLSSERLDEGQTISTSTVSISPSGLTVVGVVAISDNTVKQRVGGGTAGVEYILTFTTTLSDDSIYTDEIVLQVT